jgi:hypothetical protein
MSKTSTLHEYARIGAGTRLTELRAEMAAIHRLFPDLGGVTPARRRPKRPKAQAAASSSALTEAATEEPVSAPRLKRRKMSAAGRKAISDAQKKRWAALKKAKA